MAGPEDFYLYTNEPEYRELKKAMTDLRAAFFCFKATDWCYVDELDRLDLDLEVLEARAFRLLAKLRRLNQELDGYWLYGDK